jgi:hypothetical protein
MFVVRVETYDGLLLAQAVLKVEKIWTGGESALNMKGFASKH